MQFMCCIVVAGTSAHCYLGLSLMKKKKVKLGLTFNFYKQSNGGLSNNVYINPC